MALRSSLVAKIATPVGDGVKIGTAYPISEGYIITAYHVFSNIDKDIDWQKAKVYWQRNDEIKTGDQAKANDSYAISEIVYQSKEYDIVIAKCPKPELTNSVHWCSFRALTGRSWESIGYAKSGQGKRV